MYWHTVIVDGIFTFLKSYSVMPLSDTAIKNAKPIAGKAYKLTDNNGSMFAFITTTALNILGSITALRASAKP
jgi:hypothetical protein